MQWNCKRFLLGRRKEGYFPLLEEPDPHVYPETHSIPHPAEMILSVAARCGHRAQSGWQHASRGQRAARERPPPISPEASAGGGAYRDPAAPCSSCGIGSTARKLGTRNQDEGNWERSLVLNPRKIYSQDGSETSSQENGSDEHFQRREGTRGGYNSHPMRES